MTVRASVFIATSLDGFIARSDGSIDWLNQANAAIPSGEDCGYKEFMDTVDVLVMGRNTYEQVLTFGEWPYGNKPVVVLSRKGAVIAGAISQTVYTSREAPNVLVQRLAVQGAKHLYVDGGLTIQSFMRAGLLSEFIITVIPVLLGTGRPLFGPLESDIALAHVSTKVYDFGFVQNRYRVVKGS